MRYTVPAPVALGDCLARLCAGASGRTRKQMLAGGRVRVNGAPARNPTRMLAAGDVVAIGTGVPRAALPARLRLVHEDDDLIVVDKPPGLLTIATDRERRQTAYAHLMAHAQARRPPARVFVVHRLDREASGLLVFATSVAVKRALQAQFAAHTVERTYLAVVDGRPARPSGTVTSRLVDDAPGRVRATRDPERGRTAVTHWKVLRTGARQALLEVRLATGRRNQIPRPPRRSRTPDRRRRRLWERHRSVRPARAARPRARLRPSGDGRPRALRVAAAGGTRKARVSAGTASGVSALPVRIGTGTRG